MSTNSTSATRTVFITGCSSGIGHCVAHGLKNRGFTVIASARKPGDVKRLREEGLDCIELDLDRPESIARAVEELADKTGEKIYGLFNNAGFGLYGAMEDTSIEDARYQFEVNLVASN